VPDDPENIKLPSLQYTPLGEPEAKLTGIYDANARYVKGTWYLIEIGSREWDE
jgi:hypothetical protein